MVSDIVGPYSFGEKYIRNQELNRKREIIYNNKKAQVTPEQIERTKELAKKYPGAMQGLISNAVYKNLSDEEFEKLLALQYKAVPKSQPSFPNQYGNDVTNSLMFNSTYGKVFNSIGEQFKLPERFKFWEKPSYKNEPIYGTFKGALRVLMGLFDAAANGIVNRPLRAGIMTAGDIEEPFQIVSGGLKEQEKALIEKHKAGDPNVTIGDIAAIRDEQSKMEKTGQLAGAGLVLTALTTGNVKLLEKFTGSSFTDNYKNAGPSTFGLAGEKIKNGENPGDVWNSFGEGFFPQGPIANEAMQMREAPKYQGRNITAGRYVEDLIGVDPNSFLYGKASGVLDFYKVIYTDPALVAGRLSQSIKYANSISGKITTAFQKGEMEKIPVIIDEFVNSEKAIPHLKALAESKDFKQIFDVVGDADFALQLTKANTPDLVKNVITKFTATTEGIPKLNKTIGSIGYSKNIINGTKKPNSPYTKFGEWTPDDSALYEDVNTSVKVFNQYLVEFKIPKPIANQFAQRFANFAIQGNRKGMDDILFTELREQVKVTAKADGFGSRALSKLDDYFDELQGNIKSTDVNMKSYWADLQKTPGGTLTPIEKTFHGQRTIPGPGGLPLTMPTAFDVGQHFNETWTLGNPQNIRRTLSKIEKWGNKPINETKFGKYLIDAVENLSDDVVAKLPVQKLLNKTNETIDKFTHFVPDAIYTTIDDVLWPAQKIWTTAQLVTRIAWPLRLFGEGQFRMGLDGLDNWVESPARAFVWANYASDVKGVPFSMGWTGPGKQAYGDVVQNIVARRPASVYGKDAMKDYINNAWRPTPKQTIPKGNYVQGWQINLRWPTESDLGKKVAQEILDGTDLTATIDDFWSGDLMKIRKQLNDTRVDFKGNPINPVASYDDAARYVKDYRDWIIDLAGGGKTGNLPDNEILGMIANRKINFNGKEINLSGFNRWTENNQKQVLEFLGSKYDTSAPAVLSVPDWVSNPKEKAQFLKWLNNGTSKLWYWLGELPDAQLQRIPTFTQYYWSAIPKYMPFGDVDSFKHFDKMIVKYKVPKEVKLMYENARKNLIKKYGSIEKAVKANPGPKLTIDEINEAAKYYSLEMHNRLLYNLSQKGYAAEGLRLVFPFFEPWKEIALNYPRLFKQNPSGLRKVGLVGEKGQSNGFMYKDPVSEELYYVTAPSEAQEYIFGIEDRDLSGIEESIEMRLVSPVAGANLFTQSPLPGPGPVAKYLYKTLRNEQPSGKWQDAEDIIFPYGLGDPGPLPQFDEQLPTYMRKAYNTATEGGFDEDQWKSDVDASAKILSVAFLEGRLPYDPRTEEGLALFNQDAINLAKRTGTYVSIAKGIAPSSPRVEPAYKLEVTDELMETFPEVFFEGSNLSEVLQALLPPDYSMGKYDDDYFTNAVITAIFRQALNSVEPGDEFLAYQLVAGLIGETPDDWDAIYTAAFLVQGKTTTLGVKLPSTDEEIQFIRDNPELAEDYEYTLPYFAPDINELDLLNVNAFFNQIDEGKRVTYTLAEMEELAQERAYTIIYNKLIRPYQKANEDGTLNNDDYNAQKAAISADLLQVFPFGTNARDRAKTTKKVSKYEVFLELKRASKDNRLLKTETGEGLNKFLWGDDDNVGFMHFVDYLQNELSKETSAGRVVPYSEDKAINYLGREEKAQDIRNYLFDWGATVVNEYPEFAGLYREKFLSIVEYQYTP